MSPTRRDFLAMIAGAAAATATVPEPAGAHDGRPTELMRGSLVVSTLTDTMTNRINWLELSVGRGRVRACTRIPGTADAWGVHEIEQVRSADPAVVAFLFDVVDMLDLHAAGLD